MYITIKLKCLKYLGWLSSITGRVCAPCPEAESLARFSRDFCLIWTELNLSGEKLVAASENEISNVIQSS